MREKWGFPGKLLLYPEGLQQLLLNQAAERLIIWQNTHGVGGNPCEQLLGRRGSRNKRQTGAWSRESPSLDQGCLGMHLQGLMIPSS